MRRRPPAAVDSHDTASLRRAALRTRLVRAVLAAAAVASLAAAAASARGNDVRVRSILPAGSTGVIVVDLSLSIEDANYRRLRGVLRHLIDANAPIGLVVFSDSPYELLPPGTPARELRPLIRLLTPPAHGEPVNPWSDAFRAGTRISAGLQLARHMLERDHVRNGSILLISDLETAPDDVPLWTRTLEELRATPIKLRIVPLSAGGEAVQTVRSIFGPDVFQPAEAFDAGSARPIAIAAGAALPGGLIGLGAVCLVLLALHERLAGRLALPRFQERER